MKTSFTAFAPCGDTMAHRGRAQPVAGRLRVCTAVPPSHPRQTSISACLQRATLQHLSSMNSPCLWHCPLLCRAAIRALRQKGREAGSKTVSAQWITFRPSTQATGGWPLPGDDINTDKQRTWALTKCGSQRIQIWKQKKLTAQRVWSSWWWWWWKGRLWAVKKYKFHGKFALQTKGGEHCTSSSDWTMWVSCLKTQKQWGGAGGGAEWTQRQQLPPFPSSPAREGI